MSVHVLGSEVTIFEEVKQRMENRLFLCTGWLEKKNKRLPASELGDGKRSLSGVLRYSDTEKKTDCRIKHRLIISNTFSILK